ncbi:MAG: efflux RND transporter periplasmic adaptor subunit [Alphaproteobacteria bacterium]|nr:efflux RND transporter periplasmic adaptor subunit [Alphaproteobacteria bacterium]
MSHITELVRQYRFEAAPSRQNRKFLNKRNALTGAVAVLLGAGLLGWHVAAGTEAAAPAPAAVTVGVATVSPRPVRLWSEFSGQLRAVDAADIKPQVSGRIVEIDFHDGQMVKAGDVLFVIDPRPYAAAVAKAKADLASARTNVALADVEFARAARLVKAQALAQSIYDQRANAKAVALANENAAQATLQQAEIDLDHAYVKAPIGGRASRPEITLGNLVEAGANAPLLTSIVSADGIYADFNVDEQTYLRAMQAAGGDPHKIAVRVTLPSGTSAQAYHGTLYSFDNRIDPATGTIRARARLDNRDGSLLPGMFVSVAMASGFDPKALLVPDRAIASNQSESYLYAVGPHGTAQYRAVTLGAELGGARIIRKGLHAGDRVIVDGIQHVMAGTPLQVQNARPAEGPG